MVRALVQVVEMVGKGQHLEVVPAVDKGQCDHWQEVVMVRIQLVWMVEVVG